MAEIIYIHGASSFIGRHFIKKLVEYNIHIIIFARNTSNLKYLDNTNSKGLITIKFYDASLEDIVSKYPENNKQKDGVFIDFAWLGVFNKYRNAPEQIFVNIPMVINSIKLAAKLGVKHWIGFGSQAEYGVKNHRISEDELCSPSTVYGKSKLICSQIADEMCKLYDIEFTWLRLFSSYGPDDNHDWLIPYLIKEMLQNNPIDATKGEQEWDYIYVDDILALLFKLIKSNGIGIANLGYGQPIKINALIEKIKKLTNSSSEIKYGSIPYRTDQVMYMCADISKLKTLMNWAPHTTIDDGLISVINYIKNE